MRQFENLHPKTIFILIMLAVIPVMFMMKLALAVVALVAGIIFLWMLEKKPPLGRVVFTGAMIIFMAVSNALISHTGEHELFFINGKAITMEAVMYGAKSGLMLGTVLIWFGAFSRIMSGEKIMAVFVHFPKIGLLVSMILRLVPEYIKRFRLVKQCQDINGKEQEKRYYLNIISAVFTWAIESSMNTADAMVMRGYDKGKRLYIPCRFTRRDIYVMSFAAIMYGGMFLSHNYSIYFMVGYYFIPVAYELRESLKWKIYSLKR